MASWHFDRREGDLHVVVDEKELGPVKSLEASKKVGFVQVVLATLQTLKLCIELFKYEASSFSGMSAPSSPSSRTMFVKRWRKYLTSSSDSSNDNTDSSNDNTGSDVSNDLSTQYHHSGTVNKSNVGKEKKKTSGAGIEDQVLKEHFIGTFDVHLSNLCSPDPSRCTRVLDHDHVSTLTESFQDSKCEQLVIMVGMLTDASVDPIRLREADTDKVEVLGGNHTREALQTLMRRGILDRHTIKVNLYLPLPRTSALAVGFQHNYIMQEKRKATSFLDKVQLMRDCRQSDLATNQEVADWKDMLVVVFRTKDRRVLQQKYTHHLLMAKLPEAVWSKAVRAGEVTDKFYRQLMQVDIEMEISMCLDILLTEGVKAFKSKVKEVIDSGMVRSKKQKKKSLEHTAENTSEDLSDTHIQDKEDHSSQGSESTAAEDTSYDLFDTQVNVDDLQNELSYVKEKYSSLKVKFNTLEEENANLKKEIEQLRTGQKDVRGFKRSREITDDVYAEDEHVEAFWRYDDGRESWLPARIVKAYVDGKMYRVQYDVDQEFCKVAKSWIRRL